MDFLDNQEVWHTIQSISVGDSFYSYKNQKYLVTKSVFNNGKSLKVFAKNLATKDFISFNYYITSKEAKLKPCEMEVFKVIDFLQFATPLKLDI